MAKDYDDDKTTQPTQTHGAVRENGKSRGCGDREMTPGGSMRDEASKGMGGSAERIKEHAAHEANSFSLRFDFVGLRWGERSC